MMGNRETFWLAALCVVAFTGPVLAEPRCNPAKLKDMADDRQRAIAMEVYARVAKDDDKRNGDDAETKRLHDEVGSVKECDEWARGHGKPDDTPGRGPRR